MTKRICKETREPGRFLDLPCGAAKPCRHWMLPVALLLFSVLLFAAPAAATEYCGDFLTTANGTSGHMTGGLWYDYYPGFAYGYPGPITKTFTLPCTADKVEWARLEVVTYIGSSTSNKPIVAHTVFNGGSGNVTLANATSNSTYSWGYKSVNWDPDNNKANRVSSDLVSWYDVTDNIDSQTVTAYVSNAKPDGTQPDDGRVKSITLIVAYDDNTTGKEYYYWVNQGHDVSAYTSDPEHIGSTTFSTSSVPIVGLANLSALYISSYNGNYTFNGQNSDLYNSNQLTWSNPKQGSYWGSTSWNVTDKLTQGSNSDLKYTRNGTHSGDYSGYYKLPLALLTVENRKFTYDFNNSNTYGTAGTTLKAYKGNVSAQPPAATNVPTTEITSYSNIATDNDVYESTTESLGYAAHRFEFTINQSAGDVEKITATWVGKGSGTRSNGERLYIWDSTAYEELGNTTSDVKTTLSGTKTTGLSNYIDGNGKVILLVVQNKNGGSTLETDYIKLEVVRKT
ncbi:MAG: hypothetical protein PWQ69_522 [Methanomicrobiaceae archaeon]|nr:hypothetical protein [Methanomicrobiaceae archaeon]